MLSRKAELFKAAQKIINSKGVSHLTLDNIAKEAGISKGGLLYHFPSKNALIQEAIESVLESYATEMDKLTEKNPSTGQFIRSYAEVSLSNTQQLTSGLLAATATDPELLKPIQEYYDEWQKKIEDDGVDPVIATIIRLTVDGLWFCELFGLAPPEKEMREAVLEKLYELTEKEE